MKLPPLSDSAQFVRLILVPVSGIVVVVVQLFQPGPERWGLILAGLTMMGLTAVYEGAKRLDEAKGKASDGDRDE